MMSSADAQKSEVHQTTDDASTSPGQRDRAAKDKTNADGALDRAQQHHPLREYPGRLNPGNERVGPASNFERGAADADIARNPIAESPDVIEKPAPRRPQDAFPPDVKVTRDDSDVGGPIDLEANDIDVKE